jgi:hypothetical protein
MSCLKCGGRLAPERLYARGGVFNGFRCIMCGDVIDEQILENRKIQGRELTWDTGEMIFSDRDLVRGVAQKKH